MHYYSNFYNNNECCYDNKENFYGNKYMDNYDYPNISNCLKNDEANCKCYHSYYEEDDNSCNCKNKLKKTYQCYEGTFKLCTYNTDKNEKNYAQPQKCQKHCCFCNLLCRW